MLKTALEVLLQEAGYSARRSELMANWIDQAAIRGMSADDLFSAFTAWKRKQLVSEAVVRRFTKSAGYASNEALNQIRQEILDQRAEAAKYQMVMPFAAQPEVLVPPAKPPQTAS